MKLSIIVPTYNRLDNIKKVFTCLSRQEVQSQHEVKIILVDDGSDDTTPSWVTNYSHSIPFTYIKRPREHEWNASKPRNQGARAADVDTDAFYFLDSDVLLPPNRIQRVIDGWLQNPYDNHVIIGPYHYMQEPITIDEGWHEREIKNYAQDVRWKSFEEHPVDQGNKGISFALSCFGGSLLVPRSLFFKAGCYNERLGAGTEDGEFGLRLARTGAVFSLDKELLGWHHPHEIISARTERIPEYVKIINMDHFGSEEPDYGLIEASKETYEKWGLDWIVPDVWGGKNET